MDENIKKDLYDLNFSENFNIQDNDEQTIDLELSETLPGNSAIMGSVVDFSSLLVENAAVKLFDANGKPFIHTVADNLGKFTFSNLLSGNYSIACVKENVILTIPENIYLQENESKTYNFKVSIDESLALCSIAGHVLKNDDNLIAISGATVSLLNSVTRETVASTVSAKDGEYVFYDVKEGTYIVVANKIGYKSSADSYVSAINNSIINLDIKLSINALENLGTISGKITNKGINITNAFVGLYKIDENNKEILIATTKTNSEGFYMFGKVEGGQYKIKSKLNK